jgi:hypothetical protein
MNSFYIDVVSEATAQPTATASGFRRFVRPDILKGEL